MKRAVSFRSEADMMQVVAVRFAGEGYELRQNVYCTIKDVQVSLDLLARKMVEGEWQYEAVEGKNKTFMDREVIEQAERWIGLASRIWIAIVAPTCVTDMHRLRISNVAKNGISVLHAHPSGRTRVMADPVLNATDPDTRLLAWAFDQTSKHAVGAGSRAPVKSGSLGDVAVAYLKQNGESEWSAVQDGSVSLRDTTSAEARKKIDRGTWPGLAYRDVRGLRMFSAAGANA